jgi:hypothetical protein
MRGKIYSESEIVFQKCPKHGLFKDRAGIRFGRLTVLGFAGQANGGNSLWFCRCDCGNLTRVQGNSLSNNTTRSCGCLNIESATTHGHTKKYKMSREYITWNAMLSRVRNENNPNFYNYGGRGISVCERWLKFENFFADMGNKPKGTSIDRINNDGNYEPSNCRWATNAVQANNKRSNRYLTHIGKTQTIAQWEQEFNLNTSTISHRISNGWQIEQILTTPTSNRNVFLTHDGKTQTVRRWEQEMGFKPTTIRNRIRMGWNAEDAIKTPVRTRK